MYIADQSGALIANVDTDAVFHNEHLHITKIEEMGQYAFGNLEGWESFPKRAKPGDILVVGENFGCGSSRQQAVDCFKALGVAAIVGVSFSNIYFRNAVNAGFPIVVCPDLRGKKDGEDGNGYQWDEGAAAMKRISSLDVLTIDLSSSTVSCEAKSLTLPLLPVSAAQLEIYNAGGLWGLVR
jgi:3-isopropylmalate/(R)-2-methylmalate dehydratase small subunit